MFNWINEWFDGSDNELIEVTQNGKIAENTKYGNFDASIYGLVLIPDETSKTFKWQIKGYNVGRNDSWSLGICSAQHKVYNTYFYQKCTISYAYQANGYIYERDECITEDASGWKPGDIMTLYYHGTKKTISIAINGEKEENSMIKIKSNP